MLFSRGWSWPTENDARAVLETSKYLVDNKVIEQAFTWKQVKDAFRATAPLVKQAYERLGAKPAPPSSRAPTPATCAGRRCGRWTAGPTGPERRPPRKML